MRDWDDRSQGKITEALAYDQVSGNFTWKRDLRGMVRKGKVAGRKNNYGYIVIGWGNREYPAHRLAWFFVTGTWPENQIDHINGTRDDNRWSNLRQATVTENRRNCIGQPGKRKFSKYKGVGFNDKNKFSKWVARIVVGGRAIHLGSFKTEEQAASAYVEAERKYFGEFASSYRHISE